MKIKQLLYLGFIGMLAFSCGTQKPETEESDQQEADTTFVETETVADEPEVQQAIDVSALIKKAGNILQLPFNLDSATVEAMDEGQWTKASTLTLAEVQYLSANFLNNEPTMRGTHHTTSFMEIDSMRNNGTYEAYVEQIDIGMMQYAEANIWDKIHLDDNSFILLWTVYVSSYEGCPYYDGAVIYGTHFYDNIAQNTAVLGEATGSGDPPVWGDNLVTSKITTESTTITSINRYGEETEDGEEIVETQESTSSIHITNKGFVSN